MSAGVGYRSTTIDSRTGGDLGYSGIEFLRLQVGGEWYPLRSLGFGPFFEFDSGVYGKRPAAASDSAVYFQLQTGLRLTVDFPGR
jgi:hypothetical protein